MTTADLILATCHLALLLPLALLGLHKTWMLRLWWPARQLDARFPPGGDSCPRVTVQLPIFNERYVIRRLLDAVARFDYPRNRLQVQVLDDSTDDTTSIVAEHLRSLPRDLDVEHVRRPHREGFKAGALAHGLESATGELIAIFDADFVPPADFLRRILPPFVDARVGMVQSRWGHTNRHENFLTSMQAVLLDGHFLIEHVARATSGCYFNFNGTAGVFRRACIEDAGGWQHDTLTEDMDLSYRAQLRGWRFRYLPDLVCPADLPPDMNAFLTQQHRWAKGSIQTGRKLLGAIFRADVPRLTRLESVFHLLGNVAFPLLLGVILVAMPLQLVRWLQGSVPYEVFALLEGLPLLLATLSVLLYYGTAQARLGQLSAASVLRLPAVIALGAGNCVNNTLAVLAALGQEPGEFRRTPKPAGPAASRSPGFRPLPLPYHSPRGALPLIELLLAAWAGTTVALALAQGQFATAGFHALFAVGLAWVGLRSLASNRRRRAALPVALLAGCSGGGATTGQGLG